MFSSHTTVIHESNQTHLREVQDGRGSFSLIQLGHLQVQSICGHLCYQLRGGNQDPRAAALRCSSERLKIFPSKMVFHLYEHFHLFFLFFSLRSSRSARWTLSLRQETVTHLRVCVCVCLSLIAPDVHVGDAAQQHRLTPLVGENLFTNSFIITLVWFNLDY